MDINNILLVDDDKAVNFLNQFILTDSGTKANISVALDGRQALDKINAAGTCPDVIFLDINMPVMNGFEFLESFKSNKCNEHSKVYMLTSSLQDQDRKLASSYNCVVDYLEKPLSSALLAKIFAS